MKPKRLQCDSLPLAMFSNNQLNHCLTKLSCNPVVMHNAVQQETVIV